ncbi:hypothetical protein T484DRAFT_1913580 [Baffinella frigidus]|nr:hypothetical protein T484DRAFT_1913580 [Cryptophyta sp. CCMP2293]
MIKVYPLSPWLTRERVLAELEFYGLHDFQGVPIDPSAESAVRALRDMAKWRFEQERIGNDMLAEGIARLFLARAELVPDLSSGNLRSVPLEITQLGKWSGKPSIAVADSPNISAHIVRLFAQWNFKATISRENEGVDVGGVTCVTRLITLEPTEPDASADK